MKSFFALILLWSICINCNNLPAEHLTVAGEGSLKTGAEQTDKYLPYLSGKRVALLTQTYEGAHGYTVFSRVGFNDTLDQAVVYVGNVAAPLMGAGYYYLMEKKNGQWIITEQVMVWIS